MRLFLRGKKLTCSCVLGALVMVAFLSGCATGDPAQAQAQVHNALMDPLRVSDQIRIVLSDTPELIDPIVEEVSADGTVNIRFVGAVPAVGKTPAQLAEEIETALKPKYYAHVSVSVVPVARYFYVGGEINQGSSGGRILYSGPITVTRAIDSAGGFSPFANKHKVKLTRAVDGTQITVNCVKAVDHPDKDPAVYPGDRIYVPRRF
ncbi:MAG TPA: polysaccharide biosynthesis/export family protein [Verrucomicrobiae bacterium]|jgi:polysaccharide export outer membrane protein